MLLAHCPPFLLLVAVAADGVTAMTTLNAAPETPVRQLLNNDETADMLNVSRRTLPVWRVQGKGPKFIKIGKLVRYERTEIEAWILANTHANTSRNGAQSY